MSLMGVKRTFRDVQGMSALPPQADIRLRRVKIGFWLCLYKSAPSIARTYACLGWRARRPAQLLRTRSIQPLFGRAARGGR